MVPYVYVLRTVLVQMSEIGLASVTYPSIPSMEGWNFHDAASQDKRILFFHGQSVIAAAYALNIPQNDNKKWFLILPVSERFD